MHLILLRNDKLIFRYLAPFHTPVSSTRRLPLAFIVCDVLIFNYVILSMLLSLFELQFPYLSKGDGDNNKGIARWH